MTNRPFTLVFFIGFLFFVSTSLYAFDDANDSTVDKADRFEFEEFHKDKAITLWDDTQDKNKGDDKNIDAKDTAKAEKPKDLDKGQELQLRSAYKLSVDPALATVPTLFEAIQDLHKQLSNVCKAGWEKKAEWHKPEANYFYIHYRAKCL